ncbi:DUF5676 family membrane protein [Lewinella cohaerens]|jgi:hypothetical protein|uniref:DUF5676 family membrane protein n=1 Tax=Lewinella cohaerens TaxID=70995 RepID=UPI000381C603|nr:DUF5676 family membrane protein [Lewinella cohaerens]
MKNLQQNKFAIASGGASVVVYLGCFLVMQLLGTESLVKLSNLLFHGMDFSTIIRTDISFLETLIGTAASFVFWAVIGYVVAFIYNKLN